MPSSTWWEFGSWGAEYPWFPYPSSSCRRSRHSWAPWRGSGIHQFGMDPTPTISSDQSLPGWYCRKKTNRSMPSFKLFDKYEIIRFHSESIPNNNNISYHSSAALSVLWLWTGNSVIRLGIYLVSLIFQFLKGWVESLVVISNTLNALVDRIDLKCKAAQPVGVILELQRLRIRRWTPVALYILAF